jgi:hypothetical protein
LFCSVKRKPGEVRKERKVRRSEEKSRGARKRLKIEMFF